MRILASILTIVATLSLAGENPGLKRLCELAATGKFKNCTSYGTVIDDATSPIIVNACLELDKIAFMFRDCGKLRIITGRLHQYITRQDSSELKVITAASNFLPNKLFLANQNQVIFDGLIERDSFKVPAVTVLTDNGDSAYFSFNFCNGYNLHDFSSEHGVLTLVLSNENGIQRARLVEADGRARTPIFQGKPIDDYQSPLNEHNQQDHVCVETGTKYCAIIPDLERTHMHYEAGDIIEIPNSSAENIRQLLHSWVRNTLSRTAGADLNKANLMMERVMLLLARYPQRADFPYGLVQEAISAIRPVHLGGSCYISDKSYRDLVRGAKIDSQKPLHPLTRAELPEAPSATIQNIHAHLEQTHGENYSFEDIPTNDLISGRAFIFDAEEAQTITWHCIKRKLAANELESMGELHGYNSEKLKSFIEQELSRPEATAIQEPNTLHDTETQTPSVSPANIQQQNAKNVAQ